MNETPPDCDEDGFYSAVQCDRNGFCRCVEKEFGTPIFGFEANVQNSVQNQQDCLCARNYHDALMQGCRMDTSFKGGERREYVVSTRPKH